MKNPLTPSGIEPATFRFVAQHLNHCATAIPSLTLCSLELFCTVLRLRVVLGSRLTWRKHGNIKVEKAHNSLWDCRRAFGATWELKPKVAYWLHLAINRLSTTFVSLVWLWLPGSQSQEKANQIQRLLCLQITRTVHTIL